MKIFHPTSFAQLIFATLVFIPASNAAGQIESSQIAAGESGFESREPQQVPSVTFNSHIASIFHAKCAICHRPGEAGPFPLVTFDDIADRAETIMAVIDRGYMPPWKPINDNVAFANDRRLSDDQKRLIRSWIADGMPEGTQPPPEPPHFPSGWSLGEPDLVVTMNGQFDVPADGPDVYRSFVFPLRLPEDRWIKAVELKPSATRSIHHAIFFVDQNGNARRKDGIDGQAGIQGMGFLDALLAPPPATTNRREASGLRDIFTKIRGINMIGGALGSDDLLNLLADGIGGYVPGKVPVPLPGDLAIRLPKGSDIVMQTHFHPSGKAETEHATLALYFADKPPARRMVPVQVPPMFGVGAGIRIPAGERDYRISNTFRVPVDVTAMSVFPHGHYVCRAASMVAELPDGKEITLVDIDDWDLDWQDTYFFAQPVKLPAGTVLRSELVYDNSAANPENPHSPPQEIGWGLQSGDEMGSVILNVVTEDETKQAMLKSALQQHFVESVLRPDNIVDLLMQLDINGDGSLQASEAPAGLNQVLPLLDGNRNQALERPEMELLKEFLKNFQAASHPKAPATDNDWLLTGIDGDVIRPFSDPTTRAIALVFVSTECPIANAYQPRLQLLADQYESRGIRFVIVHSNQDITPALASAHAADFDIRVPIVLDPEQLVARRVAARVTPEVVVVVRDNESPIYRGAIDNQYADYGKKRNQATEHYLRDALDQWLDGQSVAVQSTKPIGCFISFR